MKIIHWKRLERTSVFANARIEVAFEKLELPNGVIIDDYITVTKLDVVMIVATDEHDNLITLYEYKYPLDQTILTLPAGTMTMRSAEDPLQEALRELREETGYTTDDAELVAVLNEYPTKDTHKNYIIRARNARKMHDTAHEKTEFIEVNLMPVKDVRASIKRGEWTSTATLAALAVCGLV